MYQFFLRFMLSVYILRNFYLAQGEKKNFALFFTVSDLTFRSIISQVTIIDANSMSTGIFNLG